MGKSAICIGENKDADQLRGNREADQRLCFRYSYSTIPLLLKPEISSLCLYRPVRVGPVQKQHCWFSHEAAHLLVCFGLNVSVSNIAVMSERATPPRYDHNGELCLA